MRGDFSNCPGRYTIVEVASGYRGQPWEDFNFHEFRGPIDAAVTAARMYHERMDEWHDDVVVYPGNLHEYDYDFIGNFLRQDHIRFDWGNGGRMVFVPGDRD